MWKMRGVKKRKKREKKKIDGKEGRKRQEILGGKSKRGREGI